MKKLALLIVFSLSTMLIFIPQASAKDVYAVTENANGKITEYYIETETITPVERDGAFGFGVLVHYVGKSYSGNGYFTLSYAYVKGKWYCSASGDKIPIYEIEDNNFRSVICGICEITRKYM